MINRSSIDPSLLTPTDTRSHGALVQEIARRQARLGRLARAGTAEPVADTASADRLARMADAQASAETAAAARHFEITSERLRAMSSLAAAARAADLSQRTRDNASRQFEALKWQALEALHSAADGARAASAWQLYLDPSQISQAVASASIATPDQAAAATAALNAALSAVDGQRDDIAASAKSDDAAEALDPAELARRIAEQATTSADAQANIEPANARLLLS
jgi:rubrerythrin